MSRLTQFPVNVFTSQHKFDDYKWVVAFIIKIINDPFRSGSCNKIIKAVINLEGKIQ